jgi:hypothetical protein
LSIRSFRYGPYIVAVITGLCAACGCGGHSTGGKPSNEDTPVNIDPETGEVPEGYCPMYADRVCPNECTPLEDSMWDAGRACNTPDRVVVECFAPGYGLGADAPTCYVELATGNIVGFHCVGVE